MSNPDRIYGEWVNWDGLGRCPVSINEKVTIRQRRGYEFDSEMPHSWIGWKHDNEGYDIVAYRTWRPK